ncbi:hypothetical protein EV178_001951 [Coemansia sp. RSA 1646]|nr:hypothetical protein EV178_001951 [Coemansia sp. RSA 1646]
MGLESAMNSFEAKVHTFSQPKSKLINRVGFYTMLTSELIYGLGSKIDRTVPSISSRVDRIVMDSRGSHGDEFVENERMAIVTGANSGIGFETAKALGRAGYHTILACRNSEAGQETVERLQRQTGHEGRYEFVELDLASLQSVHKFVAEFKARGKALDVLVNNAGVMMCPYSKTKDGVEMQFGTNHVGHFALTTGLLDELKEAPHARVVIVASLGAFMVQKIDYDAVADEAKYSRTENYAYSKLANVLFTTALARKAPGISVNAMHPGWVATNLSRHVSTNSIKNAFENALLIDPMTGALSSIYLALSPDAKDVSGEFYARALPMASHPIAGDVAEQDKLWEYTENLITKASK